MGYATRSGSTDIDAFWTDDLDMAKEINVIAKQYNIESGWLNSDFKKSESYTPAIIYNSTLYAKEFNCNFYIVNPELLLCMKLISFRRNKHDIADIYNIVEILNKRGVTLIPELIVS